MQHDWTSFSKSITIKTIKEKLYQSFATPAGMESWFLRSCEYKNASGNSLAPQEYAKEGDHYRWLWFGYGDDTVENGLILKANGSDLFEFTFNTNGKTT